MNDRMYAPAYSQLTLLCSEQHTRMDSTYPEDIAVGDGNVVKDARVVGSSDCTCQAQVSVIEL